MVLVMFFGGAWGYLKLLKLPAPADGGSLLSDHTALLALAALVATAVLAGLLAFVPSISPLASGLPGLLLVAWTVLYLVDVRHAVRLIPLRSQVFGTGWEELLFTGVLAGVGAVMVFPLFMPSRWRRSRRGEAETSSGNVNGLLADVTTDSVPRQDPKPQQWEEEPIIGTVLPRRRPGGAHPADATHATGPSRVLRDTGSFGVSPGSTSRNTGSFPPANDDYRAAGDAGTFGRPYPGTGGQ